jgi:hypothetical protein
MYSLSHALLSSYPPSHKARNASAPQADLRSELDRSQFSLGWSFLSSSAFFLTFILMDQSVIEFNLKRDDVHNGECKFES